MAGFSHARTGFLAHSDWTAGDLLIPLPAYPDKARRWLLFLFIRGNVDRIGADRKRPGIQQMRELIRRCFSFMDRVYTALSLEILWLICLPVFFKFWSNETRMLPTTHHFRSSSSSLLLHYNGCLAKQSGRKGGIVDSFGVSGILSASTKGV